MQLREMLYCPEFGSVQAPCMYADGAGGCQLNGDCEARPVPEKETKEDGEIRGWTVDEMLRREDWGVET